MPGRETHAYVGIAAGIGNAAFQAKEQKPLNLLLEAAGGALGGWCGGQLPDIFEPPTSSWHRSLAHSRTIGTVIVFARGQLIEWQKFCRERAEYCRLQPEQNGTLVMVPDPLRPNLFVPAPVNPLAQLFWTAAEVLWRFAAGFANGLAAGYVSHLVLDAGTPRSIPLLVSGF
jgi:LexA-binding, inner membrane-associated putative hydrolase